LIGVPKMNIQNQKFKIGNQGFTIAELLVAMSIFMVVISIAIGGFTRSLRLQRATTVMMAINDNAGLTLEQMMREIRVGENFSVPIDTRLEFDKPTAAGSERVAYQLENDAIKRATGDLSNFEPITATNVKIKHLKFVLQNSPGAPRITVSLGVGTDARDLENVITNIQTTISARNIGV